MEVKGASSGNAIQRALENAIQQSSVDVPRKLKQLHQQLFDGAEIEVPILSIACLPNAATAQPMIDQCLGEQPCQVMDSQLFTDISNFDKFWREKMDEVPEDTNYFATNDNFANFFSALLGLRSTASEFKEMSQPHNVLELYHKLEINEAAKYHHSSKKLPLNAKLNIKKDEWTRSQEIYLLPEQITVLEDQYKNIILYGAPGTGKTLLVMLKALQWSKEEKQGRVVVQTPKTLQRLY